MTTLEVSLCVFAQCSQTEHHSFYWANAVVLARTLLVRIRLHSNHNLTFAHFSYHCHGTIGTHIRQTFFFPPMLHTLDKFVNGILYFFA